MSEIARLHEQYVMTGRRLWEAVRRAYPGRHRPVQHRDRMPPWCEDCGRTANGIQIREDEG